MSATADELLRMSITGEPPASTAAAFAAAKAAGNAAFARGDHEAALAHYAAASAADPSSAVPHANSALSLLRLHRPFDAARAASAALDLLAAHPDRPGARPLSIKALLRRAAAREELRELPLAAHDLQEILVLEPGHPEATARLRALRAVAAAGGGAGALGVGVDLGVGVGGGGGGAGARALAPRPRIVEVSAAAPAGLAAAASTPRANGYASDAPDRSPPPPSPPPALPRPPVEGIAAREALVRPRGSADFERAWRSLAGRPAQRGRYVATTVGAAALEAGLLGETVTSALIREVSEALVAAVADAAGLAAPAAEVMRALTTVPRFHLAVMFLSNAEKDAVRSLFDAVERRLEQRPHPLRPIYSV